MNSFTEIQLRTFKSFITFSILVLALSLFTMVTTSQKYRISEIDYLSVKELELLSLDLLYGESLIFIDDNSFDKVYLENPILKKLSYERVSPSKLVISFQLFEELTYITDSRSSFRNTVVLYENTHTVNTKEIINNLPSLEILNGPTGDGFEGEIISFFKTLNKVNYTKELFKITYNGQELIAYYDQTVFELGDASDLGRKASVVGDYLSKNICNGTVRFVTSESTIESCS